MYTQKIANIFDHIQDHSRFGLKKKSMEKKIRPNFFAFDRFTLKILANKSGGVKPNLV